MSGAEQSGNGPGAGGIDPAGALLPGRRDALLLLCLGLVQRSVYWLFFLGIVIGAVTTEVVSTEGTFEVDATSPGRLFGGVLTPFALAFLALLVRLSTGVVALALAYPLARLHQEDQPEPANPKQLLDTHLDRLLVARAFRALRWTRGVRAVALERLGETRPLLERVDHAIGIANLATGVACVLAIIVVGGTIEF